jgi:chromosome segregation protein
LHITELEIDNFKSFSKKTKIPFLEGFTVISGPNGSGKSNIIDSILFVLALSSSRNREPRSSPISSTSTPGRTLPR